MKKHDDKQKVGPRAYVLQINGLLEEYSTETKIPKKIVKSCSVEHLGECMYRVRFEREEQKGKVIHLLGEVAVNEFHEHCQKESWKLGIYDVGDVNSNTSSIYFDMERIHTNE